MYIGFCKAAIVLKALLGEARDRGIDIDIAKALGRQFSFEFGAAVFAARQRGDREIANSPRRLVAQASASADSCSSS